MIQDYRYGGLKLVDIQDKFFSLKTIHVQKLICNPGTDWAKMAYSCLPIQNKFIWRCNTSQKDIRKFYGRGVWLDIWHAWSVFNYKNPTSSLEILDQPIVLNSYIRIANKPIMNQNLINMGPFYVRDLYNELENRFISYQECVQMVGQHIDFVLFHGIIRAIPEQWKKDLKKDVNIGEMYQNLSEIIIGYNKPSNRLYNLKRTAQAKIDAVPDAWKRDLNLDYNVEEADWNAICYDAVRLSICPKLRYFQYRLIHRRLTTNYTRSKYDPDCSAMCSFCKNHTETVTHLFWYCPVIADIWKNLFKWIKYICKFDIVEDIDIETIIFCNYKGRHKWFVNTVLLITKQYIYRQKCMGKAAKIIEVLTMLHDSERTEAEIAKAKNLYHKHCKKWSVLLNSNK